MKSDRMFGILCILLERENVTVRELAGYFEVSTRTIHRDLLDLSASGFPVVTRQGVGGGVSLLPNFRYNKSALSEDDMKVILAGIEGLAKIQAIMENLRQNTPTEVGGYKVLSARDYKLDTIKDMETGEVKPTGLPASNVLYYDMNDGAWICVRPSGTEPKIKFYYGIKGESLDDAEAKAAALGEAVMAMVDQML